MRTFVDSGVLLTAARSVSRDRERALQILEDPNRIFLTSPFIELEVVPKAAFHKKTLEKAFYDEFFRAAEWFRDLEKIATTARLAMDALHVTAAHLSLADELVTSERPAGRCTAIR